jgi:hypothetical protein
LRLPVSMVVFSKITEGASYDLVPGPVLINGVSSYTSAVPAVTASAATDFPMYPHPLTPEQLQLQQDFFFNTYQDVQVTIRHEFCAKDYDPKRGKVTGRALLCDGVADRYFEINLWNVCLPGSFTNGSTWVFYDVFVKANTMEHLPADRMKMSGSLSGVGCYEEESTMRELTDGIIYYLW